MVVRMRVRTQTSVCHLTPPSGQPVVTRDVNDRITTVETTHTSIKKTTTAVYDTSNLITTFTVTLEDVV